MDDMIFTEVGGWYQFVLSPGHSTVYVTDQGEVRIRDEIRMWLDEFTPQGYRLFSYPGCAARLQFKNRAAAVAFKVAWH